MSAQREQVEPEPFDLELPLYMVGEEVARDAQTLVWHAELGTQEVNEEPYELRIGVRECRAILAALGPLGPVEHRSRNVERLGAQCEYAAFLLIGTSSGASVLGVSVGTSELSVVRRVHLSKSLDLFRRQRDVAYPNTDRGGGHTDEPGDLLDG
jgi:hypothetical protein